MELTSGLMIMHNGHPVELLHRVDYKEHGAEEWLVRPLFVDDQRPRKEVFKDGDRYSKLHGQHH
jgi:hypothetical protein